MGKVETTIPHPENNKRNAASFIPIRPERSSKALAAGGTTHSHSKRAIPWQSATGG